MKQELINKTRIFEDLDTEISKKDKELGSKINYFNGVLDILNNKIKIIDDCTFIKNIDVKETTKLIENIKLLKNVLAEDQIRLHKASYEYDIKKSNELNNKLNKNKSLCQEIEVLSRLNTQLKDL
jgi:hypothetical protein